MEAADKPGETVIKSRLLAMHWGGHALVSLYISVLSGIVIGLQYSAHDPFYSTATIELIVPFGSFWRAMHYYSSQAFFLLLLCHLTAILWKNDYSFKRSAWIRLTASVPVALLLLFTGYVLRGDATGEAAGAIAEHITLSMPLIGESLNSILFDISAGGMKKVLANHLIGLMVLGGFCVWPHLRRYTALWRNHVPLTLLILAMSVLLTTPMEPDRIGLLHIAGPWFFLGLQELLRYIPAFWAGVFIPATIIVTLLLLPIKNKTRRRCLCFIILWLVAYAGLSYISYARIQPENTSIQKLVSARTPAGPLSIPETLK
jgi:ubiquinol-cytochrome c reductase cytochrome b subunit